MPAGRPTELTPEVIEDVRRVMPTAMNCRICADHLGIDRTTYWDWRKRGEKELRRLQKSPKSEPLKSEAIYAEFANAHKKAIAAGLLVSLGTIKKASDKHWQAAAWLLERRFPEQFGSDKATIRALEKQINELLKELGDRTGAG